MAVNPSTAAGQFLRFHTPALEPNSLIVLSADGRDALSHLYAFELKLVSRKKQIDLQELLRQPAFLAIKQGVKTRDGSPGVQTRRFHGVLAWIEQADRGGDWTLFRGVLVPRLWRLSLPMRSRIFMKASVPKIVETILLEHGFRKEDFRIHPSRTYVEREYVVQYQETDLDFLQRLLEKEGLYYFFTEGDDGEIVHFADSPSSHGPIQGRDSIRYRAGTGQSVQAGGAEAWFAEETVRGFAQRRRTVQQKVVVQDYNYRTPGMDLSAEWKASPDGFGLMQIYGEHYKTKSEGELVARLRAEEIVCGERTFHGRSDVRSFRAGATFSLSGHYTAHADYDRSFLLTEIRHRAEQMLPSGGVGKFAGSYENEFTAIPSDVPYRPPRRTPVPRANNINAKIDAAGSGDYAELDADSRYKVQMPFDPGKGGGTSSRYMRLMQPYAGAGMGMHFPLHVGTEVLITHVNSDWDRPLIAGALPNPETASPVKGDNQSQCVIATGGGNKIAIEDAKGGERISISTPYDDTWVQYGSL